MRDDREVRMLFRYLVLVSFFLWFACYASLLPKPALAEEPVDLELVLAVDVSRSMDIREQLLQRRGYVEAFKSKEVIDAITQGGYGQITALYMEWAGTGVANVIVPWTLIKDKESAYRFADLLGQQTPHRLSRTSISNAVNFASAQFGQSPWKGLRRVIDVSGDGPNNQGAPIVDARDQAVQNGIIINGLPLMIRNNSFGFGVDNLDSYYFDCVTGGTGSFVLPVYAWEEFPQAVRRKLVLEITQNENDLRPIPISSHYDAFDDPNREKVDCLVGEKQWEQRMRDLEWR
ncbi:MAG: DUF1194 domain-containing protein [Rhizobiaceae bacterium]